MGEAALVDLRIEERIAAVDFDKSAVADLKKPRRGGAREVAIVTDEEACDVGFFELRLQILPAINVAASP